MIAKHFPYKQWCYIYWRTEGIRCIASENRRNSLDTIFIYLWFALFVFFSDSGYFFFFFIVIAGVFSIHFLVILFFARPFSLFLLNFQSHAFYRSLACTLVVVGSFPAFVAAIAFVLPHNLMLSALLSLIQYVQLLFGGAATYQNVCVRYDWCIKIIWIIKFMISAYCSRASFPFRFISLNLSYVSCVCVWLWLCCIVLCPSTSVRSSIWPFNHCQLIGNSVYLFHHLCNQPPQLITNQTFLQIKNKSTKCNQIKEHDSPMEQYEKGPNPFEMK